MSRKGMLIVLIITISYISIVALSNEKTISYKNVNSYRGIRVGTSSFHDAMRILGKPTVSISSNKNQIKFSNNMYFHYKNLGIKFFGKSSEDLRVKSLRKTKIVKILRKK